MKQFFHSINFAQQIHMSQQIFLHLLTSNQSCLSLAAVPQTLAQTNKTQRENVSPEGWSPVPPKVQQKEGHKFMQQGQTTGSQEMGRFKTQSQYYKTVFSLINSELKLIPEYGEPGIPVLPTHIAGVCGAKPKTPTKQYAQEKLTSGYLQVEMGSYS